VELIQQPAQRPGCVAALAERLRLSLANSSQQLKQLRERATQRDGACVAYRPADEAEIEIVSFPAA